MSDEPSNILTKLFAAAIAIVVLGFAGLGLIIVTMFIVLDQSEVNQRHVDCIVALAQPVIPEFCQPVKEQLIKDGIIAPNFDRSTTTTIAR